MGERETLGARPAYLGLVEAYGTIEKNQFVQRVVHPHQEAKVFIAGQNSHTF